MPENNGFVSDDGSQFTVYEEEGNTPPVIDESGMEDFADDDPIGTLVKQVDVSKLPEDQKPIISKLTEALKTMSAEVGNLKKNAEITDVLKQLVETKQASRKMENGETDGEKVVKKLSEQFTFEDKDYYAPFFKQLADAVDNVNSEIGNVRKEITNSKASSFQEKVMSFVTSNKIPEKVIVQMDRIAKEIGPGAYNNLDRLHKMAKLDLGIKDAPRVDLEKKNNDLNGRFAARGVRRNRDSGNDKPATSMREAFNKALEQLEDEE
jgi:hypothetical protein